MLNPNCTRYRGLLTERTTATFLMWLVNEGIEDDTILIYTGPGAAALSVGQGRSPFDRQQFKRIITKYAPTDILMGFECMYWHLQTSKVN